MYKFREKQAQLEIKSNQLIQACITRWGSTLAMLERLQEQQAAIAAVLVDDRSHRHLIPDVQEWILIAELITILKPFQLATEISASKYPTVSLLRPFLFKLMNHTLKHDSDTSNLRSMKEAVATDLSSRYSSQEIQTFLDTATYLDPRYKELPYLSEVEHNLIHEEIEEVCLLCHSQSADCAESVEPSTELPPSKKPRGDDSTATTSALLGDVFIQKSSMQSPIERAKSEVRKYNLEEVPDLDADPMKWWAERSHLFSFLSQLVRKYFAVVATSVPSEQLFSTAGNLITDKRNRLLPQNVDKLLFLHENKD
jgi:hypothetical protein